MLKTFHPSDLLHTLLGTLLEIWGVAAMADATRMIATNAKRIRCIMLYYRTGMVDIGAVDGLIAINMAGLGHTRRSLFLSRSLSASQKVSAAMKCMLG